MLHKNMEKKGGLNGYLLCRVSSTYTPSYVVLYLLPIHHRCAIAAICCSMAWLWSLGGLVCQVYPSIAFFFHPNYVTRFPFPFALLHDHV